MRLSACTAGGFAALACLASANVPIAGPAADRGGAAAAIGPTPKPMATSIPYKLKTGPLDTPWTGDVGTSPWPEHPRPQLVRNQWQSLNGIWTYQAARRGLLEAENPPSYPLAKEVLIPSCIESALSGIMERDVTYMWFATRFRLPKQWLASGQLQRVLLNFEAVDYEATVFINGENVGHNRGGYFRFTFDVTDYLRLDKENEIKVLVYDPTDEGEVRIPVGKQAARPSHIFYTPCSGIWQTVWLENAPLNHITQLDLSADMHGQVNVTAHASHKDGEVEISVLDPTGHTLATGKGRSGAPFQFQVKNPKLWSPNSPTLYNISVKFGQDHFQSYTGFRTVSSGVVNGVLRPLLNGEFVFLVGTLDQGFWPDGIYLPPTLEAMKFDLLLLKKLGMNMVRKHIKIEPDLFYRACDEIGLLVFQDMPCMTPNAGGWRISPQHQAEFERQVALMVNEHKSYPCIFTWVIYNEGWGQFWDRYLPEFDIVRDVRRLDPTRLIDATSGWEDHGAGDYSDNHHYASPQCGTPFYSRPASPYDPSRIGFLGEFGGLGHMVPLKHLWNVKQALDTVNETYEIHADLESYNRRAHWLFEEVRGQVETYACSGIVYTQTTDVEGEINGLVTYDRRFQRIDVELWQSDIQALHSAAARRAATSPFVGNEDL